MSFPVFKYFPWSSIFVFKRKGFTLVELLIVIAILGILSAAVVAVLSPAELLKQARDSTRVADLDTLNTALKLAEFSGASMGSSSVVSLSLPDTSATCASYTLPSLPSGWAYRCATSANLNKTDGTGWIPVNFSAITETTFSSLPIDPSQNATSSLFYAYAAGNRYAVSAVFESAKYGDVAANDGGYDPSLYEAGANPTLAPFMHGLVGYWNLDESSGTSLADSSGYGNTATASGTTVVAGKVGNARYFKGNNNPRDMVLVSGVSSPSNSSACAWVYPTGTPGSENILSTDGAGGIFPHFDLQLQGAAIRFAIYTGGWRSATTDMSLNTWYHVCATFINSTDELKMYVNGNLEYSGTHTSGIAAISTFGGNIYQQDRFFLGNIDEVRIYGHILSAAEVMNLYNATR